MATTHIDLREIHIIGTGTRERMASPSQCVAMQPYHMRLMGISETDGNFKFIRKRPNLSQFLLCLSGRGEVLCSGAWQVLKPGQAYVTPVSISHAYHCYKAPWKVLWVAYDSDASWCQEVPHIIDCDVDVIQTCMEQCLAEIHNDPSSVTVRSWLQLIDSHVKRAIGVDAGPDAFDQVWESVLLDIAAPWHVHDLAQRLGISEEHFRRRCLERFQLAPMRHLTHLRMQHAANMLSSTELSIGDIAQQVGYQNSFAFSTAFRRWAECSPRAYRQKHR